MEITKVGIRFFKQFLSLDANIESDGITILAGPNNAGKSTFLEALSLWSYACRTIDYKKGRYALLPGTKADGCGVTLDEFTPIAVPSFNHLWNNEKVYGGYSMDIACWWRDDNEQEKFIGMSFALNQAKLFMKIFDSNITREDQIPTIVYLPTFAGIQREELWCPPALRRRYIGQGLTGAVLRNQIVDLYDKYLNRVHDVQGSKKSKSKRDVEILCKEPYIWLNTVLGKVFGEYLVPTQFNKEQHTHVEVCIRKGRYNKLIACPEFGSQKHDLLVAGKGFVQWLSVFVNALSPDVDILLLDEPDAHLHNMLQTEMMERLQELQTIRKKQIIIASHSVELLSMVGCDQIMTIENFSTRYLETDEDRIALLQGIGADYSPFINRLKQTQRILFVEDDSDGQVLMRIAAICGMPWPQNVCIRKTDKVTAGRVQVFQLLCSQIPDLQGLSIVDRDDTPYEKITRSLSEKGSNDSKWQIGNSVLLHKKWRRREIENYLICPRALAKIYWKSHPEKDYDTCYREITEFLRVNHGLDVNVDYKGTECTDLNKNWFDADAKVVLKDVGTHFHIKHKKYDILRYMDPEDVCEDLKTMINNIIEFAKD